jgi:hypothetical protein
VQNALPYGVGNKEERREIGRSRCDKRMTVVHTYLNISILGTLMCLPLAASAAIKSRGIFRERAVV